MLTIFAFGNVLLVIDPGVIKIRVEHLDPPLDFHIAAGIIESVVAVVVFLRIFQAHLPPRVILLAKPNGK